MNKISKLKKILFEHFLMFDISKDYIKNTNFYEIALVGPDCPNAIPPVYSCGYSG